MNENNEMYIEENDVKQPTSTTQMEGGRVQTLDTTVNHDDAGVVVTQFNELVPLVNKLTLPSSTGHIQEIRDFLKKPQIISSGVLSTTDTVSTFGHIRFPSTALSYSLIKNKLEGYFGMRSTIVLRLQVNGTRFQQGRYMLCAVPLAGSCQSGAKLDTFVRLHSATLTQRTQLPHVEFDVACDSVVELRLPYISSRAANLVAYNGFQDNWDICLYPYSALEAGSGDNTASYTLWFHMEDVELTGVAIPQSGIRSKILKKNATETEQESLGIQPLSSGLKLVSNGLGRMSQVPLLSTFARPASWVADVMSKAAWSLGYSKPANLGPEHKIIRSVNSGFANSDNPDNSAVLAYTSRNQIQGLPGFAGTDVDELAIKTIACKYAYYASFNWADSAASGTPLSNHTVYPGGFSTVASVVPAIFTHTPVTFTSKFFRYYRGSMKIRFKFVKTEFHSGRLMISYMPNTSLNPQTSPSLSQTQYIHREVIDLRSNNEAEFVLPYIGLEPYKLTDSQDQSNYPLFTVHVLDPLIAPSTVPSTIRVLCEVAAGDDIEFAVPRPNRNYPTQLPSYQMGDSAECGFNSTKFGGKQTDDLVTSSVCIGEHVTSFRQLLKVPCFSAVTDSGNGVLPFAAFNPFAVVVGYYDGTTYKVTYTYPDIYSILGSCFALQRGSVRVKMIHNLGHSYTTGNDNALAYYVPELPNFGDWVINRYDDVLGNVDARAAANNIAQPFVTTLNNGLEVLVPQYSRTHSRSIGDCIVSADANLNADVSENSTVPLNTLIVDRCASASSSYYFARCGGDDLDFGMFISVPPSAVLVNDGEL